MSQEYLSVAIWRPLSGKEPASLETIRELNSIVARKGYGRDLLYRSGDSHYILLRYWNSESARLLAHEDPEMLRCWAKLGNEIEIVRVYEKLEEAGV